MKKNTKRKNVKIMVYVVFIIVLFFTIYGVRAYIRDVKHRIVHQTEVTITTEELEKRLQEKEIHFLEQDVELIGKLKNAYYDTASTEEQLEILARIGYLEAEYLGIAVPDFKVVYLRNDITGYYDHDTHQIVLNIQHLSHEKCAIRTVLHEMYHVYQYACIQEINTDSNLLWARQVADWKAETDQLSNDFDSNEGLVSYYTTSSETTARNYAQHRIELYFIFIETKNS